MSNQVFVGVSELSHLLARLGVAASPPTVRRWCDVGTLPYRRGPGGRILVRLHDAAVAVGLTDEELLAAGGDDEAEANEGWHEGEVEFND